MNRVIIKQFLHDGYVFNFTDEAVNSDKGIIGFYFDGLGFPQSIHRDSIFGSYIVGAKNTEQLKAENQRLRALVSMAVEMLTFEYTAGDGVPEKFSAEWDLLLRQAQEGRG